MIRSYRAEDLSCLHEIDRICFPPDLAYSRAELLFYLNHRCAIARIAESHGSIVGFCLGRIEADQCGHVLTLDVLPEVRRRKIGTMLINELHDAFRERNAFMSLLEVRASDSGAQRFYEGLRYDYVERVPDYYNGREDAYRMARFL